MSLTQFNMKCWTLLPPVKQVELFPVFTSLSVCVSVCDVPESQIFSATSSFSFIYSTLSSAIHKIYFLMALFLITWDWTATVPLCFLLLLILLNPLFSFICPTLSTAFWSFYFYNLRIKCLLLPKHIK